MGLKSFFPPKPTKRMRDDLVHPRALRNISPSDAKPSNVSRIAHHIRRVFCTQERSEISHTQADDQSESDLGALAFETTSYRSEAIVHEQIDATTAFTVIVEVDRPTSNTTASNSEIPPEIITVEICPTMPSTASPSASSQITITRQAHNASIHTGNVIAQYGVAVELSPQCHTVLEEQLDAVPQLPLSYIPSQTPARLRSVSLPARIPERQRQQAQTANEACEGYRRRQLIKNIAYRAAFDGCEGAVGFIDKLNAHSNLKARYIDTPDLTLSFDGVEVSVNQLQNVEWKWVSRFNAAREISYCAESRLLSTDDCEVIFTQLFPTDVGHLYRPEHFEIFVAGLGEEGILTKQQAQRIAALGVTVEELDAGAHFIGPSRPRHAERNNPSAVALFAIPKQARRAIGTYSNGATRYLDGDLFFHLRILAEAAVYEQKFWKSYFIPNARSLVRDFHEAYVITQDGWPLPSNLIDFERHWNYREIRLLQRACIIGRMMDMWDAGQLTDFGIIRAVRGTFLHLPMHSFWSVDELESFLYSRVTGSGLPISKIPEILALHPDNDGAFAHISSGNATMQTLVYRSQEFEEEEEFRLIQIQRSQTSFESAVKAQMTIWQRGKAKLRKVFGMERKLAPFDPFSPEHETKQAI